MVTATKVQPLKGIRVLNCTQWVAGPLSMRFLADLGAEVIKIESIQHPDPMRMALGGVKAEQPPQYYERSLGWIHYNRNQYGLTLDLGSEEGGNIFRSLVAEADVVAENLRPGIWEGWGFAYEKLKQINPRLIAVQLPGYGTTGPWKDQPSWALSVEQMSGFSAISGYPNEIRSTQGWPDGLTGIHAAFALLAALWRRKRTGQGQFIDLSQLEVMTAINPEPLIDYQFNGRIWGPQGNRSRWGKAPHGCFRCAGDDEWIAVAVETEEQWNALAAVIGEAEWLRDPRFATMEGRYQHEGDLNGYLERWTLTQNKMEMMHRLQKVGVPAAAVAYGSDLVEEGHLWQRGTLERVERAVVGEQTLVGTPFLYGDGALRTRLPAPTLGQHNYEILRTLAGLTAEEVSDLEQRRIIGTEPL